MPSSFFAADPSALASLSELCGLVGWTPSFAIIVEGKVGGQRIPYRHHRVLVGSDRSVVGLKTPESDWIGPPSAQEQTSNSLATGASRDAVGTLAPALPCAGAKFNRLTR